MKRTRSKGEKNLLRRGGASFFWNLWGVGASFFWNLLLVRLVPFDNYSKARDPPVEKTFLVFFPLHYESLIPCFRCSTKKKYHLFLRKLLNNCPRLVYLITPRARTHKILQYMYNKYDLFFQ
jgi:hypothetical protein